MNTKKEVRNRILKIRDQIPVEEQDKKSQEIFLLVTAHPWFKRADAILVFASFGSEVQTDRIMEEALKLGKEVYCPVVNGENMDFYRITSLEDFHFGYKGIREPSDCTKQYQPGTKKTLLLLPGVAFDRQGHRIGYGKGFYDRYLAQNQGLDTMALAYDEQLLEEIPHEIYDYKPNSLLTEKGVIYYD